MPRVNLVANVPQDVYDAVIAPMKAERKTGDFLVELLQTYYEDERVQQIHALRLLESKSVGSSDTLYNNSLRKAIDAVSSVGILGEVASMGVQHSINQFSPNTAVPPTGAGGGDFVGREEFENLLKRIELLSAPVSSGGAVVSSVEDPVIPSIPVSDLSSVSELPPLDFSVSDIPPLGVGVAVESPAPISGENFLAGLMQGTSVTFRG